MPVAGGSAAAVENLLPLALSRPHDAIAAARTVLAGGPPAVAASIAHQAWGIGLRQLGEVPTAVRQLRTALRLAEQSGRSEREADVLATLGATLGRAGRGREGLARLDRAVDLSRGALTGRVLLRRADVLLVLGRHREALDDLRAAITRLRRSGDQVWEARSRNYRGFIQLALGGTRRADADFAVAEKLYAATGQEFEYAEARQNRGLVAYARGDLPAALRYLDEAGRRFAAVGVTWPDLAIDRCGVLLAAGLSAEALAELDQVIGAGVGTATKRGELLFAAATAALAAGDPAGARERAERARRLFSAQRREWWAVRSSMVVLEARYQAGERGESLLRRVTAVARRLDTVGASEATAAHLLAGRLALAAGRTVAADRQLELAGRHSKDAPPIARSAAWLGKALRAEARGDVRSMLSACGRGLDALDEHRLTMGATELRALATGQGAELAELALRDALRRDDPRRLLVWAERWRATALGVPPVRPSDDEQLAGELAALRDVVRRLDAAPDPLLDKERRRLEKSVRDRTLRAQGASLDGTPQPFDVAELMESLGETVLVELVEVAGVLHALVVRDGRITHREVGPLAAAALEVDRSRFHLRRLAHTHPTTHPPNGAGGRPSFGVLGRRLGEAVLGSVRELVGDRPVVVVPPGRLQALPWGLVLDEVNVVPSAAVWLRAREVRAPVERRVVLVLGPGLPAARGEVMRLAAEYPDATVLADGEATADNVLRALDGAWIAHIAAHGTFRADSPLFSSLRLDDGPLTVYDFERLRKAPYRMVLSSCDSGLAKPVGADELLGLSSSLIPLGAAGILASVVPVNDPATAPLMLAVHANLRAGQSFAKAFATARRTTSGDPAVEAAGRSFVALGA
ncbi:CHAT domain-containing tetratricopeptide repeat protein [Kribbella sp.]|uniref:CHAT domain-containing protein n=1 Tax=Kribbella sp. TaxID=1871183 RepID=UPI002D68D449|nr:CHAT domain-containing tetratricopeptide repeat protein [Kribbella sp.]HZX01739.1 CHAT domain-containing tetratricopeptide repeat protein [Kribbella sp.]